MTTARRARMMPEQRRAQLIELGKDMLAGRSIEELSIEELADQAGISRGLLFHYFGSKQEFHLAVATAAAKDILDVTEPNTELSPADRLTDAMSKMVDYVSDKPDAYISLVRGAASGDSEMRDLFERTRDVQASRIIEVLPGYGVESTPALTLAVHGWVAFAEEAIVRWLRSRSDELTDSLTPISPRHPYAVPLKREELTALLSGSLTALIMFIAGVKPVPFTTVLATD